jgi:hypothetical protein
LTTVNGKSPEKRKGIEIVKREGHISVLMVKSGEYEFVM